MYVIGTAGHVDHGKSTLVKALTGIDPDRWAEEQRREMTIDLGFAWFTLPSGRSVSLIDVPGHERFIKNMLAGVGGLDAALLVIAADEAIMPQTAEHLAILDLLGVEHGVVVLSKADLVDEDWLTLVREEVSERLAATSLAGAPIVAVSARSGQGLDDLRATIDRMLDITPSRGDARGIPRLPIDRSFTIGGFGTVVTGTLIDGSLSVGQELEILPQGLRARVRGLQTHQQREELALPGSRVAVNLVGVHHSEISRGDVLSLPGAYRPTTLIDLQLRMLRDAPQAIVQNTGLDLFVGATEVRCRVTLLDAEALGPGASGWVQLRLDRPVLVARGDRCILRIASPSLTIAGGTIVDPHPPRHRRFRAEVMTALETLARGAPDELLLQALGDGPPREWEDLVRAAGLPATLAEEALATLLVTERVLILGITSDQETGDGGTRGRGDKGTGGQGALSPQPSVLSPQPVTLSACHIVSPAGWAKIEERLLPSLRAYHKRFPLRRAMPREELRQKLRLSPRTLGVVLDEAARRGSICQSETGAWIADHAPKPVPADQRALDSLLAAMARAPYSPPSPDLDGELLAWAIERELLVKIGPDIYFLPQTYAELLAWVQSTIAGVGSVSVGQLRDHFGSSRKYALAFLEHLDERKITRREGEARVLY